MAQTVHGVQAHTSIADTTPEGMSAVAYYDATNPEARSFVWERVKQNYLDYGVRVFWLDADEPELMPMHAENIRYALGNGLEVTNIYPLLHQKGFYEGMLADGQTEVINLSRSAWAGTQRYGAAVWSGDIRSRFDVLRAQIPAGLNIAMSGIPWWTTDIGGFMDGDIRTDYFKELVVRWFQYGVFCPLFRLHGVRLAAQWAVRRAVERSGQRNLVVRRTSLRDHPQSAVPARKTQALSARSEPSGARSWYAADASALLRFPGGRGCCQSCRRIHARS